MRWLPPIAWMALIAALSHQPDIPRAPSPWLDFVLKKTLHAAGYAVLAWLWWRPLRASGADAAPAARWAFAATVLYAAADEWHQSFVPGRTARARDVGIDAGGAAVALAWLRARAAAGRGTGAWAIPSDATPRTKTEPPTIPGDTPPPTPTDPPPTLPSTLDPPAQ